MFSTLLVPAEVDLGNSLLLCILPKCLVSNAGP